MVTVRKAYVEDFDGILPLLLKFSTDVPTWKKLFVNHWNHPENYYGFVLTDEEKIIGFLGTIFSSRVINGKVEKFCNLSTWIVDEQYKKHGLSLFLPILELEDYTITNFSSAEKTYIISKKLGFEDIESNLQYVFPVGGGAFEKSVEVEFKNGKIEEALTGENLKIFKDHLSFDCQHVLIRQGEEICYLIIKKTPAYLKPVYYTNRVCQVLFRSNLVQRNAFLGHIHYVSNRELFKKVIGAVCLEICWEMKTLGLLANAAWLKGSQKVILKPYKTFSAPLFKSTSVKKEEVDSLYSEIFVINS